MAAFRRSCAVLGLFFFAAAAAVAQPTGRLAGHVENEDHAPLPGALVTVTSPALMGARSEFSDTNGGVNFHSLPPGVYTVDVELDGFVPQRRSEVEVRLNRVTEIRVDLEFGEFEGEITVVAETPVVDPEQVSTSQTFTYEHLQESSVGSLNRRYYQVLAQAPGVAQTQSRRRTGGTAAPFSANPHVFGSTQAENVYYIDSIDSTDPVSATVGVHLNFDTIQEINFETGGFEARYGRATGGVVNVITKAGGNDVAGAFDLRYRDTSFNTDGEHFDKDEDIFEYSEPSFTLGGPMRRDRLWYFTGLSRIASKITPTGSPTTRDLERDNVLGKLTWQANDRWQVMGRYVADKYYLVANLPQLSREYRGLLLDFETRWSSRAHIMASYVVSESKGNLEYTGTAGSDYDVYPAHFENRYGFLSDHRKHRVKVHGHLSLPKEFVLGFGATWSSPFVYTPWTFGSPYGAVYQAPRGSLEANGSHQLDLQVSRAFRFGGARHGGIDDHDHDHVHHREHGHGVRARLMASVYNALDDEQVIAVCTYAGGCWQGADIGAPTRYREPRRFEVGVRLEF